MEIRHATEADLPRIVDIYNTAIPTRRSTADIEAVTTKSRLDWFHKHTAERRPLLVGESGSQIAGWISFEDFYGRLAYQHTAELSIYVAPAWQGHGLGKQLLHESIMRAPTLDIRTLIGYIFAHNEASLGLFGAFGFSEWARLPNIAEMDGHEYSLCILGKQLIAADISASFTSAD